MVSAESPLTWAVMVTVRFVGSAIPEENVMVAWPWASVTTEEVLIWPAFELKATVMPVTPVLLAFKTAAVMVVLSELSLFTEIWLSESEREAGSVVDPVTVTAACAVTPFELAVTVAVPWVVPTKRKVVVIPVSSAVVSV